MVNPLKAKEKAVSSEGLLFANKLEKLNWAIQMKQFELAKLDSQYKKLSCEYKEFLGYELSDKEKEELKNGSAV